MSVLGLVTCRAVQERFFRTKVGICRLRVAAALLKPEFDLRGVRLRLRGFVSELLETDARERDVIHFCRARDTPLVFEMAGSARADIGVKGGWLALEDGLIVGMAGDALVRIHSFDGCVAGRTIILQRCVGLRQFTGTNHVLPKGEREHLTLGYVAVM